MKRLAMLVVITAVVTPVTARAQSPIYGIDGGQSEVIGVDGFVSVLMVPDGSGPTLDQAHRRGGGILDATLHIYLRGEGGGGIPYIDADDIWLVVFQGYRGVQSCRNYHPVFPGIFGLAPADADTDGTGHTTISGPIVAGGREKRASEMNVAVACDGYAWWVPINYVFHSPDINGDRRVDLVDIGIMARDFGDGLYHFKSDLNYDSVLDLRDQALLWGHYGATCPE